MGLNSVSRDGNSRPSALAATAAALLLAGCSGGGEPAATPAAETAPNIVQPGAPGEASTTLSGEELEALEATEHADADVAFVQGMIHHHAQALAMTALVPERAAASGVKLIARRMEVAQEAEIEQMQAWLEARGERVPQLHREHGEAHGAGDVDMPGMLTDEQMDELRHVRGAAFDRLFLRFMIQHHRGAQTMVEQLYAGGGGLEPEVDALARHIDADQGIEIARMEAMLAEGS